MTTPQPQQESEQALLSNCCNAPLKTWHGDEGTSYYECTRCLKAADPTGKQSLQAKGGCQVITPQPYAPSDCPPEYFGTPIPSAGSRNCPIVPKLTPEQEKRFNDQPFCFTDYDGRRRLHTNYDTTDEVKAHLATELALQRRELEAKYKLKKCLFCKRKYRTDKGLEAHQSKCFKNPNRVCTMCDGDGLVDEVMSNGYMGHKNHPCYDCETSKKALLQKETI